MHTKQIVQISGVTRTYASKAGVFHALQGISLSISKREFVAITGKSGSGKSTLVNIISGIDRPTAGEVWVDNTPIHSLSEAQLTRWRGINLGIVFQFFQLLPTLSLLENVILPMDFTGKYPYRHRRKRALELLAMVDIAEHAHKLPTEVSGGQQQRVAIARALANDPPLLVADEPTGNLDSASSDLIFELFTRLIAEGKTLLMVTHDQDLARKASRIVTVADGLLEVESGA